MKSKMIRMLVMAVVSMFVLMGCASDEAEDVVQTAIDDVMLEAQSSEANLNQGVLTHQIIDQDAESPNQQQLSLEQPLSSGSDQQTSQEQQNNVIEDQNLNQAQVQAVEEVEYSVSTFLAQSHLISVPDLLVQYPYVTLIRNREASIVVRITADSQVQSPTVIARIISFDETLEIPLVGPEIIPESLSDPSAELSLDNSFVGVIPKEIVREMKIEIVIGGEIQAAYNLWRDPAFQNSTQELNITLFDFHFFSEPKQNFSADWIERLENRFPIQSLKLNRVEGINFNEMVVPPLAGKPAFLVTSKQDYVDQTGLEFNEAETAISWVKALRRATSSDYDGYGIDTRFFYGNLHGGNLLATGISHKFSGVGPSGNTHQLFKVTGMGIGFFYGSHESNFVKKVDSLNPIWGFDALNNLLVSEDEVIAGYDDSLPEEDRPSYPHFTSFATANIQYTLSKSCVWNEQMQYYEYADIELPCPMAGEWGLPHEPNKEVLSIMMTVSAANPSVNYIYPVIGPYLSDLIDLYDPTQSDQLNQIDKNFCPDAGCDITARVTQGGEVNHYLLSVAWEPGLDPTVAESLWTTVINVPATLGDITKIELLLTPEAQLNGVPSDAAVLYERIVE